MAGFGDLPVEIVILVFRNCPDARTAVNLASTNLLNQHIWLDNTERILKDVLASRVDWWWYGKLVAEMELAISNGEKAFANAVSGYVHFASYSPKARFHLLVPIMMRNIEAAHNLRSAISPPPKIFPPDRVAEVYYLRVVFLVCLIRLPNLRPMLRGMVEQLSDIDLLLNGRMLEILAAAWLDGGSDLAEACELSQCLDDVDPPVSIVLNKSLKLPPHSAFTLSSAIFLLDICLLTIAKRYGFPTAEIPEYYGDIEEFWSKHVD